MYSKSGHFQAELGCCLSHMPLPMGSHRTSLPQETQISPAVTQSPEVTILRQGSILDNLFGITLLGSTETTNSLKLKLSKINII